jgi:thioredoxin reductase (NADPH)
VRSDGERFFKVSVVGAGPSGLFAASMLRMLGLSVAIFEAKAVPGGQCTEAYEQKPVHGLPAFFGVKAKDFVHKLCEQTRFYAPSFFFETPVVNIKSLRSDFPKGAVPGFLIETPHGDFSSSVVLIATGVGEYQPVRLDSEGCGVFENKSLFYCIKNKNDFREKDVVIAGGGDAAVDWTQELLPIARSVTLVHRRDFFRCAPHSAEKILQLEKAGKLTIHRSSRILALKGTHGYLTAVEIATPLRTIEAKAQALLVFFGLVPKIANFLPEEMEKEGTKIRIRQDTCETSIPGIFAVGDAVSLPHRPSLIITGLGEASVAAHAIARFLNPQENISLLQKCS